MRTRPSIVRKHENPALLNTPSVKYVSQVYRSYQWHNTMSLTLLLLAFPSSEPRSIQRQSQADLCKLNNTSPLLMSTHGLPITLRSLHPGRMAGRENARGNTINIYSPSTSPRKIHSLTLPILPRFPCPTIPLLPTAYLRCGK